MKVADYVIKFLEDMGIREVFVVYGAANGDLIDAFTRMQKIKYVCTMHEQGGGFAAEGYAKINGNFGVSIATSGPGGMNLVTPIGNCFYDSVPCLFLTGQINSQFLRQDPEIRQVGFQETDIVGIVKPITKYAKMITKAEDVAYELEKAMYHMKVGRPGPVLLDIPLDVQKKEIDPDKLVHFEMQTVNQYACDVQLKARDFLRDLQKAKRPVIMVGGGARSAFHDLKELGRALKIPMFPTWNALDIVCSDDDFYGGRVGTYGGPGRNFAIQNSDLLLTIGSRISGRITGGNVSSFARKAKKYFVDVDPVLLQRKLQQVPADVNVLSDAWGFVRSVLDNVKEIPPPDFSWWMNKAIEWREVYDPVKQEHFESSRPDVHPYAFARILSDRCTPNDIIVADCGGNIVVMNHAFKTKSGQRYFTNNGNSPMGFSMCGAIGAWFARHGDGSPYKNLPKNVRGNVVCITGDGGMTMNIQELSTIKNYNVDVKIFIMNNHIYGITKAFQEVNFEGRSEACGPKGYVPPNFIDIAEAYGITTYTIKRNHPTSLALDIDTIFDHSGPMVIDVICDEFHSYYPKISGWKTPIEDMEPYLDRKEFKENMFIDPLPGWEECKYTGENVKIE
jgi:acetolactate synthase-1/2/3 large subunit